MKLQTSMQCPAGAMDYLRYFENRQSEMVQTIKSLVEIESPTDVKQAVDRLGIVLASRFDGLGGKVTVHRETKFGNHLQVDFSGRGRAKPVLLLGHLDTVYPIGTLSKMPCRVRNGRIYGPGVLDMKSGIALMLESIQAFKEFHGAPPPVTVLLVSDEELGSESSRRITEKLARKSAAALVLEPAAGLNGAVKTARKGVGEYLIEIKGKAAHAGLDFKDGASAIVELAKQILKISQMYGVDGGITLNAGIVRGGSRVNVIPDEAAVLIDVRVPRRADAISVDKRLRSLKPLDPKCTVQVTGAVNRPPMERTAEVAALYRKAFALAKELGWTLEEASVGGGSDGNFTAALGVPTLDGLGGVGEGAHANHESVVISQLPRRAALLAMLIETIAA